MRVGIYVLLGVYVVYAAWAPVARWVKGKIAANWPMARAECKKSNIAKVVKSSGGDQYECFELTAFFSYKVGDEIYEGEYTEDFGSLPEAEHIFRSLKNGPLFVRYSPTKPWDNVLDPYRDVRPTE